MRDAAHFFSEYKQRGELSDMDDDEILEGHLIIYYQHGIEQKLLNVRHSNGLKITSYNHSCLTHSHTCVDTMQAFGNAKEYRAVIEKLQNTPNVDKVVFISAPMREDGCC